MLQIFVNNEELDLYQDEDVKFTFQVNDIADVKDRQANYTNAFNIPKTPNNVRVFSGLGIHSDTSNSPYNRLQCSMKYGGISVVNNGWLHISETGNDYKCFVYSGIVNFFKLIENKTLKSIGIEELNHYKLLNEVVKYNNNVESPVRYLISDYNGLSHYKEQGQSIINITPLVPSVLVSYLWDKIHQSIGFTYTGRIFNTEAFKNLWITYPKTAGITDKKEFSLQGKGVTTPKGIFRIAGLNTIQNEYFETIKKTPQNTSSGGFTNALPSDDFVKFKTQGYYNLNVKASGIDRGSEIKLFVCKTTTPVGVNNYVNDTLISFTIKENGDYERDAKPIHLDISENISVNENDHLYFVLKQDNNTNFRRSGSKEGEINLEITITYFPNAEAEFDEQLKQYSIKDFVKEILNRFGLTMFIDEETKTIHYSTLQERLNSDVIDWSEKYIERISETYTYNNYAQINRFKYQYDTKEADTHDYFLEVKNENLNAETEAWKSKTFAPERNTEMRLGNRNYIVPVLKFFEKEVKENKGQVTTEYKPLDKRFFFVKSKKIESTLMLGNGTEKQEVPSFYIADFTGCSWQNLLSIYYDEFRQVISKSRIHTIELNLSLIDVISLDLQRLYYFVQEQQFYILNKINYSNNNTAKGEFVMVEKGQGIIDVFEIEELFTEIQWWYNGTPRGSHDAEVEVNNAVKIVATKINNGATREWQVKRPNADWEVFSNENDIILNYDEGTTEIRLKITKNEQEVYSNTLKITYKPVVCREYRVKRTVSGFRDTQYLEYNDCNGTPQRLEIPYDSGAEYTICAKLIKSGTLNYTPTGKICN